MAGLGWVVCAGAGCVERTRVATRVATSQGSSCDQNRMTVHPAACSAVVVWLSRAALASILAFQYARLEAGGV